MNHATEPDSAGGRQRRSRSLDPDGSVVRATSSAGDVSVYYQGSGVVVLLRGHIDVTHAQELEEAGTYAIAQNASITVDVRHVDLIDSMGISFLIRVAVAVHSSGGSMFLGGPAPYVEEMLQVAGAASLFTWVAGHSGPDRPPNP